MNATRRLVAICIGSIASGIALADVWDGYDDTPFKARDLAHGADEIHDLGARPGPTADVDWLLMPQDPYSSYEIAIDGIAPSANKLELTRFDPSGTMLLQTAIAPTLAGGGSRVLSWANTGASSLTQLIRVNGASCDNSCTPDARYRIRAVDTTIAIPRFNNTATQVTVLLVQNTRSIARTGMIYFWSATGTLLALQPMSLPARGSMVLNTTTVAAATSGTITIAHDAGYGGLAAKSVALEPATGFSFDTQGVFRPR
ncbi:MAG TPA: hypothetical protein VK629_14775 [Steroidobacteraceae bacterium]|nr:hypothetical protein [Steroidobacteraceae bacterium]